MDVSANYFSRRIRDHRRSAQQWRKDAAQARAYGKPSDIIDFFLLCATREHEQAMAYIKQARIERAENDN